MEANTLGCIHLLVSVSVPASVANVPVVGNVTVVVPVAVSVVLNAPEVAKVELFANDNVPVVVETVKPLIDVAVAAPSAGVTKLGDVANTTEPEPVELVSVGACAADPVPVEVTNCGVVVVLPVKNVVVAAAD